MRKATSPELGQSINSNIFSLALSLIVFLFFCGNLGLYASVQTEPGIIVIGPSISKHFNSYTGFNHWHPGIGGEYQYKLKNLVFGIHGYYMAKDSNDRDAFWGGFTAGYLIGSVRSFWLEPFVLIGGIKKYEFHSGKFGFFALPVLSVGYRRFGVNIGFIPEIPEVTNPILIVQFKFRIL